MMVQPAGIQLFKLSNEKPPSARFRKFEIRMNLLRDGNMAFDDPQQMTRMEANLKYFSNSVCVPSSDSVAPFSKV
jgi:hypothetical protein